MNVIFESPTHKIESAGTLKIDPDAIRKISKRAFMRRFTQAERIAIRKSTDDIVIDIHEDLKATSNVDLDLQDTEDALAYLTSVGILVSGRKDEILIDGTEDEI
jgi:hypothetical protein